MSCLHIETDILFISSNTVAHKHKKKDDNPHRLSSGELAGARTQDPNIKSVVLYLLSYEFIAPNRFWWCKDRTFFSNAKIKCIFLSSSAIFRKLQTHFIFYHKHLDYLQTLLVNKKQAHLKSALVLCFVVRITP